jgi:hypothetical protein
MLILERRLGCRLEWRAVLRTMQRHGGLRGKPLRLLP